MSSLTVDEDQRWVPTHVQVTVLRGRGLRGKGKHGTSDAYTIIQLGKEKYSTGVVEKSTAPEWKEECCFELPPGVLQSSGGGGGGGGGGGPAGELLLTVMHRALIGLDVFLGQAVVPLDKLFKESRCVRNEWYRLNSKTGKKEKERGDIQVTVQFTRNNLTASMYDLVMKDKSASTFTKLKERMRGKRRSSEEDSSASSVVPQGGGSGSLARTRHRLPSDGGGEEDYEDDEGGEARRSKMRTFFLRGKLRKSSDTRSSTSLGSESSESSRGGSLSPTAGISVVVSDLSNSPSNSSNLTADNSPEHTASTSPRSPSLGCDFGDEAGEITIAVPQPRLCVNGSHAYRVPATGTPADSLGLEFSQKPLPLSVSLQNLGPRAFLDPQVGDGRRWSFDKPGEEEKAAIAAALEQSGPMQGEHQQDSSSTATEAENQGKKQRRNAEDGSEEEEEKHKRWFASKDSQSKPSLVVSPKLGPSTDPRPNPPPPLPPHNHPPGPPVSPLLHHTNPFCPSQATPPPISPCNPFFSVLQHNPFSEDTPPTSQTLRPSLPPLPFLSSSRPAVAQLFPQASCPNRTAEDAIFGGDLMSHAENPILGEKPLTRKASNPFTSGRQLDPEWDESFEAFAAGRLQPPEGPTADCTTQHNTSLENRNNTNPCDSLHPQPIRKFLSEATDHVTHASTFAQFLETIPEQMSFEGDNATLYVSAASTNKSDRSTHAIRPTDANASSGQLGGGSSDPGSSGLGSSAEDDFLSCLSSSSDKFSASSSSEDPESKADPRDVLDRLQTLVQLQDNDERVDSHGPPPPPPQSPVRTLQELVTTAGERETEGAHHETRNITSVMHPKLLEPKTDEDLISTLDHAKEFTDSFVDNLPDVKIPEFSSSTLILPSLDVLTSSPDVMQSSWDASRCSPVPFQGFRVTGPDPNFDATLLHTPVSHQSSGSFLQSLYVSTESQDYQTCASLSDAPHSADSTLCGDLSHFLSANRNDSAAATAQPRDADVDQTPRSEEHWCEAGDKTATSEMRFKMEEDFGFEEPPVTGPRRLSDGGVEMKHLLRDQEFSKPPQVHSATLQRSHSDGTLTPAFHQLLLTSFGSDPGAIGGGASSSSGPSPLFLTSPAPPLTPGSSPVALCSLPLARSPPSAAIAEETHQLHAANQETSPHPVKPLTTAMLSEEKRPEGRSVLATGLEKLKSTIHPGRSSQISEQETHRRKSLTEGAGSYYHLTHSELVALLVRREAELERQRAEAERHRVLLAKREVELRRLKPQVKDLEDYIDTLLVRIMEQKPTLLQVRSKLK